ncbi:pre-rRNA 2'-O-ribose RNA methyltransferase FTSJ3 [Galendromus occidentalis]|uniref:Putative rRNA methyltransferase n=1 Tax=Galendromus occidentalis TaxID=34638 RepID=A0AAJ6QVE4_9ACAR|nr:pre-rRNA 2'-O-ribose RNA methyltransferase FTSJ3 [Galendromus occidentalis]
MGVKSKTGKQRRDKFYHLAKETGYRSRASFKLIQLNRKFEFLQRARVLVDLCAAPGGWLQVAQKYMPASSLIVGVDLVPIRPIPNVVGLTHDITTPECRKALRTELKTWKADVVLNDGAPNVGKNWLHDAYAQICLSLHAAKLASEFLVKGGWFVTKVFRSKDYNAFIWVLKKLFRKVSATKPRASRHESAEIFVVCQGFVAPDKLDDKFFNPKYLFEELDISQESAAKNVLERAASLKKPKAEGYKEGAKMYETIPCMQFIKSVNFMELLGEVHEILLDSERVLNHPLTTDDIKEYCKDIKVLGKGDLKTLCQWRRKLHEQFKKEDGEENVEDVEMDDDNEDEDDEETKLLKHVQQMNADALQELKRVKRKKLRQLKKTRDALNLKMIIKGDEGIVQEDKDIFQLKTLEERKRKLQDGDCLSDDSDLEEIGTSGVAISRKRTADEASDSDGQMEWDEDEDTVDPSRIVTDMGTEKDRRKEKAASWFSSRANLTGIDEDDLYEDIPSLKRVRYEVNKDLKEKKKKKNEQKSKKTKEDGVDSSDDEYDDVLETEKQQYIDEIEAELDEIRKEKEQRKPQIKKALGIVTEMQEKEKEGIPMLDAYGRALGERLIQSGKSRRDLFNEGFHRYMSDDRENLPSWFKDDEKKYCVKLPEVSSESLRRNREDLKEVNVKTIKRVVEAKSRKKRRFMKRMDKARKKAEDLCGSLDMSETEKAQNLKQIYSKALKKDKKEVKYVVSKKFQGLTRVPKIKGNVKYKVVDSRMKKDLRSMKNKEKTRGRKKGGKGKRK